MISRVLSAAFVFAFMAFSAPVFAQTPGCNPQVLDAMTTKNDALVGYDMSVVQEAFAKPDSILAMTCFNRAAGLDASEGGKIFSEDFMVPLKDMIEPWLTAFFDEFTDAAGEGASGWMPNAYAAAATVLDPSGPTGTAAECGYIENWWTEDAASGGTNLGFKNKGIQLNIPYITTELLRGLGGNPGSAGANFLQKWGQIETALDTAGNPLNIRTKFNNAMTALPLPTMPAAGFINDNTVCAVMTTAGITCP